MSTDNSQKKDRTLAVTLITVLGSILVAFLTTYKDELTPLFFKTPSAETSLSAIPPGTVLPNLDMITPATLPQVKDTSTPIPHFDEVVFCLETEFDKPSRSCTIPRTEFYGQVDKIYVSWKYNNVYDGMHFSRKWYRNNQIIREVVDDVWDGKTWSIDGESEFTWLDASSLNQSYFPPGFYSIELLIDDTLEQTGRFSIVQ